MPSSVRSTFAGLEVKTVRFQNPATQHVINIAGVMHLAHDSFWANLQDFMNQASKEGVLHLEGVKGFVGPLSEEESEKVDSLKSMASISLKMAEITKLTFQKAGLKIEGLNAKNIDADVLSVARRMTVESLKSMSEAVDKFEELKESESEVGKVMVWVIKNMGWVQIIQKFFKTFSPAALNTDPAILDYRNEIAIEAALKETKPVTLVWGAGHIPGMTKLLNAAGYVEVASGWNVAVPRSYKLS